MRAYLLVKVRGDVPGETFISNLRGIRGLERVKVSAASAPYDYYVPVKVNNKMELGEIVRGVEAIDGVEKVATGIKT